MGQFNKLKPAEAERLFLLLEELGEVQQIIGKVLRHGYESCHPKGKTPNRTLLENELGDVFAAVEMMVAQADLNLSRIIEAKLAKLRKVKKYLHHQGGI